MDSQKAFEAFNHFIVTRDPNQLLVLAKDIEVFSWSTFDNGQTYIGEMAPSKFRNAIASAQNKYPAMTMAVNHALIGDQYAKFFLDVSTGRKKSTTTLDIVMSKGKLKCFHEMPVKIT